MTEKEEKNRKKINNAYSKKLSKKEELKVSNKQSIHLEYGGNNFYDLSKSDSD